MSGKEPEMIVTSCQKPRPANREVARTHAKTVAAALASKVMPYRRITLGEPQCHFRVPFHTEVFWCKVLMSDEAYVFTGEHKRVNAFSPSFCASLKHGWSNMVTKTLLPEVSRHLGVDVYAQSEGVESRVAEFLLESPVRENIGEIDFDQVTLFFLNPVQITVIAKLVSSAHCVEQVHLYRRLLEALFVRSDQLPK